MTKESKVGGKIFLPQCVIRNPKVQRLFKAEKRKVHRHREFTPSKYDIANRTLYANEIAKKMQDQRERQLSSSLQQFKMEHGIS